MSDQMPDPGQPAPATNGAAAGAARGNVAVTKLLADIEDLKKRVAELEEVVGELINRVTGVYFVEHAGVLFKKRPKGGYEALPYCPACKVEYVDVEKIKFQCPQCKGEAPFKPFRLGATMDKLPKD